MTTLDELVKENQRLQERLAQMSEKQSAVLEAYNKLLVVSGDLRDAIEALATEEQC